MKIVNDNLNPDKDQLRQEREARRESKMISSYRPKKGHKMYKFCNGVLSELKDSDYYDSEVNILERPPITWVQIKNKDGKRVRPGNRKIIKKDHNKEGSYMKTSRKIRIEPDTKYFSALNLDNAKKHCAKHGMIVKVIEV